MITVVPGSGLDVAAIMPVMDDAFAPEFGEAWTAAQCLSTLALPGAQLLIARNSEKIMGFTLSRWVADEEELLLIGVARSARRQGVGRALIGQIVHNANNNGRAAIFLEVRETNVAQFFYREMGFVPVGKRPDYYRAKDGSRHDSITMMLHS